MWTHVETDNVKMLVADECDSQLVFRSIFEVLVLVQHSTLIRVALIDYTDDL